MTPYIFYDPYSKPYVWPRIDLYIEKVQQNTKYVFYDPHSEPYIYIYTSTIILDPYSKPYVWPRIDLYIYIYIEKAKTTPNIYFMTPILVHTYGLELKSIAKYI